MVEILNAVVIINVIPARVKMVLKSFVMARFDIPSNDGIMLKIKLTGRNIALMIKSTCEKIMIPVNRNTNMEIPILKTNRKKTVPKRLMVFVMVRLVLLLSSISSATIFSLSSPLLESGLVESRLSTRSIPILSMSELLY